WPSNRTSPPRVMPAAAREEAFDRPIGYPQVLNCFATIVVREPRIARDTTMWRNDLDRQSAHRQRPWRRYAPGPAAAAASAGVRRLRGDSEPPHDGTH